MPAESTLTPICAAMKASAASTWGTIPSRHFAFHPGLPDRGPLKGPQRFETTIPKVSTAKAPSNLEDLGFLPVTELAPLVRSCAVSSSDVTKMYLARRKQHSEKLLCLGTLTEDRQAPHGSARISLLVSVVQL